MTDIHTLLKVVEIACASLIFIGAIGLLIAKKEENKLKGIS